MNEDIMAAVSNNLVQTRIKRGNKFTLIGMDIDLTDDKNPKIGMQEYIQE